VGVVGAGLMGHAIAQVVATSGRDVVVRERDDDALAQGLERIDQQLARAVSRGRLEDTEAKTIRGRVEGTTDYGDMGDCDLIVEAVVERTEAKLEVWGALEEVAKREAIFATNTSSLSVVGQAAMTRRPDRFVGMHFFNPPQVMRLVEVVRAITTSDETYATSVEFVRSLDKLAVESRDTAGFIVNRLLVPYLVEAIRAHEQGVGSIEQIDEAMRAGAGHPMGPLTLADFIGLDTFGAMCDGMYDEFRDPRFAQPSVLRKMLAAGWLGRKSGMGFYDYSGDEPVPNRTL
jgi:3-hydroxybutyryl-CoA dehydrogenase